jgi:hypothetical protein
VHDPRGGAASHGPRLSRLLLTPPPTRPISRLLGEIPLSYSISSVNLVILHQFYIPAYSQMLSSHPYGSYFIAPPVFSNPLNRDWYQDAATVMVPVQITKTMNVPRQATVTVMQPKQVTSTVMEDGKVLVLCSALFYSVVWTICFL